MCSDVLICSKVFSDDHYYFQICPWCLSQIPIPTSLHKDVYTKITAPGKNPGLPVPTNINSVSVQNNLCNAKDQFYFFRGGLTLSSHKLFIVLPCLYCVHQLVGSLSKSKNFATCRIIVHLIMFWTNSQCCHLEWSKTHIHPNVL